MAGAESTVSATKFVEAEKACGELQVALMTVKGALEKGEVSWVQSKALVKLLGDALAKSVGHGIVFDGGAPWDR